MSKVAIQGNASGTGTFTIAAPNSNTDRTLTLPDEAGTVLTSASSIPASSVTGLTQGITEADQWVLETNVTTNTTVITDWHRIQLTSNGYVGTGMSVSSGVFTFPSTGIYLIGMRAEILLDSGDSQCNMELDVTTDGSSFNLDQARAAVYLDGSTNYGDSYNQYLLDVTDTSNVKVRFRSDSLGGTSYIVGSTIRPVTTIVFIRLGDT